MPLTIVCFVILTAWPLVAGGGPNMAIVGGPLGAIACWVLLTPPKAGPAGGDAIPDVGSSAAQHVEPRSPQWFSRRVRPLVSGVMLVQLIVLIRTGQLQDAEPPMSSGAARIVAFGSEGLCPPTSGAVPTDAPTVLRLLSSDDQRDQIGTTQLTEARTYLVRDLLSDLPRFLGGDADGISEVATVMVNDDDVLGCEWTIELSVPADLTSVWLAIDGFEPAVAGVDAVLSGEQVPFVGDLAGAVTDGASRKSPDQ